MGNFDYTVLKEFCKVRNIGDATMNGNMPTPRMNFITDMLKSLNIEYTIDSFTQASTTDPISFGFSKEESVLFNLPLVEIENITEKVKAEFIELRNLIKTSFQETSSRSIHLPVEFFFSDQIPEDLRERFFTLEMNLNFHEDVLRFKKKMLRMEENKLYNIVLPGKSSTMLIAHHDIKNPDIDNCNDNSASIINLIALKLLMPDTTIVFTDGEELGGIGADRLATMIKAGEYGSIRWVVNLELTAVGGTNFIVGRKRNSLFNYIRETFECEPFDDTMARSDASILHEKGIQSCVITTLPKVDGKNNYGLINYCHGKMDTIGLANYDDMKEFVEKVLVKLVL
jgi:hypothetical protein